MKKLHKLIITLAFMALSILAIHAQTGVEFKITTWNVEWLSCTNPDFNEKDRELQINNVVAVLKEMNSDIVALQEVGTSNAYTTMDTLVKRLGSDWGGYLVPWNSSNCSQNQGIVYKKSKIKLIYAALVTEGGSYYNWSAGRYPVLYDVDFVTNSERIPVSFINVHAKASWDETSYARRKAASIALKNYLDGSAFYNQAVVVIGDLNDYLIGTTCKTCGGISPYKNFMDDATHYKGVTAGLSKTIDNVIISNELFEYYVNNSAFVERAATQIIPNYKSTTSDHYPVSVIFNLNEDVGIADFSVSHDIRIYPNPASYELRITNYELRIMSIEIFDVYGRVQKAESRKQKENSPPFMEGWQPQADGVVIDISHLQPGLYFVKIITESGIITKKMIKN